MDEKLKQIIAQMIENGESQSAIDFVIGDYNSKKKSLAQVCRLVAHPFPHHHHHSD